MHNLPAATAATVNAVPVLAAWAGLATLLDLLGDLLDAPDGDTFDDVDAVIAIHRAELMPLLDVARQTPGAGGPLHDAAVEVRRHVEAAGWPL